MGWQVKNFHICDNFKFIKDMQSSVEKFRARWQSKESNEHSKMEPIRTVAANTNTKWHKTVNKKSKTKSGPLQGHIRIHSYAC